MRSQIGIQICLYLLTEGTNKFSLIETIALWCWLCMFIGTSNPLANMTRYLVSELWRVSDPNAERCISSRKTGPARDIHTRHRLRMSEFTFRIKNIFYDTCLLDESPNIHTINLRLYSDERHTAICDIIISTRSIYLGKEMISLNSHIGHS